MPEMGGGWDTGSVGLESLIEEFERRGWPDGGWRKRPGRHEFHVGGDIRRYGMGDSVMEAAKNLLKAMDNYVDSEVEVSNAV